MLALVGSLALLLAAFRCAAPAAPTAIEDCGPDQLPRDYDEMPRAEIERRCTQVIARGSLGPLRIGEAKQQLLDELGSDGVERIALLPVTSGVVSALDPELEHIVASSQGILVRNGEDPDPLRIEIKADTITRVMGGASELDFLRDSIRPGRTRTEALAALRAQAQGHRLNVEPFVPGGDAITLPVSLEALGRVLDANRWRFDVAPSLCGFQAFYSRVDLVFETDRLKLIQHFCFPYELP
jgi:hypothetical protein